MFGNEKRVLDLSALFFVCVFEHFLIVFEDRRYLWYSVKEIRNKGE